MAIEAATPEYDLTWSFRPIVYSMRLIGIQLDASENWKTLYRYAFILYGILMFALTCYSVVINRKTIESLPFPESAVVPVRYAIAAQRNVVLPIVILTRTATRWQSLWKKMREIEQNLHFSVEFYRQIRKTQTAFIVLGVGHVRHNFEMHTNWPGEINLC